MAGRTKSEDVSYAEEVYAACATVGFHEEPAAKLKRLLDRIAAVDAAAATDLRAAARRAHHAAANWADRRGLPGTRGGAG